MKKILVISPTPSHPQNAGNRCRIYRFLRELQSLGFKIHFVYTGNECNAGHVSGRPDFNGMAKTWEHFVYLPAVPATILRLTPHGAIDTKNKFILKYIGTENHFRLLYNAGRLINSKPLRGLRLIYDTARKSPLRIPTVTIKKLAPKVHADLKSLYYTLKRKPQPLPGSETEYYSIDEWYNSGINKHIKFLHNEFGYTSVLIEYVFMSKALEFFGEDTQKVIDTHDIFTNRAARYHKSGIEDNFFTTSSCEEGKGLDRADIVIAIQDKEAAQLASICNAPVTTIGHPVLLQKPQERVSHRNNILYVGAANTSNIQGINHFFDNIFPMVQEKIPSAKVIIAGAVCKELKDQAGCEKLGQVEDLADVYNNSDIIINPGTVGTGLKIKNVEALGFAKPLITTAHGGEGMIGHEGAFIIAKDDLRFASEIIDLLTDSNRYNALCQKAYDSAKQYNKDIRLKLKLIFED